MPKLKEILEAVHPMAVHVTAQEKNKSMTVTKVGKDVTHVKPGDKVTSSDLDDLSDAGHKVKEIKEDSSKSDDRFEKYLDAHFEKQDKKRQAMINNQLRQGKTYKDAAKAAGAPINEKLTDDAKQNIQTALGPKTPKNKLRASSSSARAIIALAKTNEKNIK